MKKILLLISLFFVITGCEATYNLEIGEEIKEEINIYTTDMYNLNVPMEDYNNFSLKDMFGFQLDGFYPVYFNDENYNPYLEEKQDNVKYYNQSAINDSNKYGIKYDYRFKFNDYYRSRAVNSCYKEVNLANNNGIYSLTTNNVAKCFDNYSLLDRVTINIKTTYKVIYSNADNVSNGVYTWNITKNNYKSKSIKFSYNTNNSNFEYNPEEPGEDKPTEPDNSGTSTNKNEKASVFTYILLGAILMLFFIGIFGLIKYKSINKNE